MAGQGSPRRTSARRARTAGSHFAARLPAALLALVCALASGPLASRLAAADLDVRVRIAWGWGEPEVWQGSIRASAGTLSDPVPLGLEADVPGSVHVTDGGTVTIFPHTPGTYNGVDLRVQAPADAKLIVELGPPGAEDLGPIEIPLAKVLRGIQQFDLDQRGSRLRAQRSPGDALRVKLARDSVVFSPGEKLELSVTPQGLELAAATTYLLEATLTPSGSDEKVGGEERELRTGGDGQLAAADLAISLPPAEGVYDLKLALFPKRLTLPLVRGKPLARRTVQFVSVATVRPIDRRAPQWHTAYELDPANPSWWERMARMPSLRRIPAIGPQQLTSGPAKTVTLLGRPWIELPAGGWQAYPLAIESPGLPHLVEVAYPSDFEQTLGVSIVEPGPTGQVQPIGVDSGFEVGPPAAGHQPQIKRHRLVFWPRTKAPWVLLTNRRPGRSALVGQINVLAGPSEPPPLVLPPSGAAGRTLAAYYDKPLMAENFSSEEAVDPLTGRAFDDWGTFLRAGQRMVAALQHGGYSAVVLSVASEGSSLYPSPLLQPTPKYDMGIFFETGQDPVRKDVLELLLRLCDRAGIQVIPAVQFAAPLPELEAIRLAGGPDAAGIEPLGPDGRTWIQRSGGRRGMGVHYNPLDPRVQQAMQRVISELAERYADHPSFGGVAVQWTAESYAILPDETCSFDDATIARFEADSGLTVPGASGRTLDARSDFLRGPGAKAWLAWRAQQLATMYRGMQAEIARARPSAKLYLSPADLVGGRNVQQALRPTLPPDEAAPDVLLMMGVDPKLLADEPGIVLPRPYRVAAGASPEHQALVSHWNQSSELDTLFARRGGAAAIHFHEPAQMPLAAFDRASPFGADKTHTWLVSQISPADAANRKRLVHSLAVHDSSLLIDGGWLLPLGQEESLLDVARVFRRLPAEPLETARSKAQGGGQGIVVRTLAKGSKTYFYAVNDTPWPANLEIDFSGQSLRVQSYAENRPTTLDPIAGGVTWSIALEPYDLVGGELATGKATVSDYRVTYVGDPGESLRQEIRDLLLRANALRDPLPRTDLANPSFEAAERPGAIPGWVSGTVPAMAAAAQVSVENVPTDPSGRSLHLVSRGNEMGGAAPIVWVRSDPIPPPRTGRIAVVARIRVADAKSQPQLRLAIEGKRDGQAYYRYGQVGRDDQGRPAGKLLGTEWSRCPIIVTDLPLEGLTDLRVGFDLMGAGDVWIDDVQVFDLWFEEPEQNELQKSIALARVQWSSGQLADCQRFLEGYWPSFLRLHIPAVEQRPAAALVPPKPPLPGTAADSEPPPRSAVRSSWDKMRGWVPWLR